jgi:hypothetical protein
MQANNKESTLRTASFLTMLSSAGLLLLVGERTAAGLLQWISALRGGLRGDLVNGPGPAVILGSMGLVVVALSGGLWSCSSSSNSTTPGEMGTGSTAGSGAAGSDARGGACEAGQACGCATGRVGTLDCSALLGLLAGTLQLARAFPGATRNG